MSPDCVSRSKNFEPKNPKISFSREKSGNQGKSGTFLNISIIRNGFANQRQNFDATSMSICPLGVF